MNPVTLQWATPQGDAMIAEMARVSNPANQYNTETAGRLIAYCIRNQHWSIFEMANMCVQIDTTRDIARQILRHKGLSVQEFSQRYADAIVLPPAEVREARLQDPKNRQSSTPTDDARLQVQWADRQHALRRAADEHYQWAVNHGIAKEVARTVLPEGLTPTRLYVNSNLRSWIHYCKLRMGNGTQKEHADIARDCFDLLCLEFPTVGKALAQLPKQQ